LLPVSFILAALAVGVLLLWFTGLTQDGAAPPVTLAVQAPAAVSQAPEALPQVQGTPLSPIFTSEVRHWESDIQRWAAAYGFDPNLVATVMQIESCGNPHAVSGSGAQGLFQVMPFHFSAGEEMQDPQTNATRGLNFLTEMLKQSDGHVGLALVGYNGGYRAVQGNWYSWAPETRRYYRWGAGIHMDAITGLPDSPTLHEWLDAGGVSLCQQAHVQLGLP
jgi:soluble lytic murein transglycosylase-like protein